MKPPRVSIAGLMVLVGFVAANFAAADALDRALYVDAEDYLVAVAPFASVLLLALSRLARDRGAVRAFWGGFLVLGSMSLASLVCYICDMRSCLPAGAVSRLWDAYLDLAGNTSDCVFNRMIGIPYDETWTIESTFFAVAVALPQLAVALAGGLIARSVAVLAARRRDARVAPPESIGS